MMNFNSFVASLNMNNNMNGMNNIMGMGMNNNMNNGNGLNDINNFMDFVNIFNQLFMYHMRNRNNMNSMSNMSNIYNMSNMNSNENQKIERKEGLDIKCDIDRLLHSNCELENKNKDLQTIINFIPSTTIKDTPKKLTDEYRCVICLSDFEIEEKVSALPCCHTFHTNCLDNCLNKNENALFVNMK